MNFWAWGGKYIGIRSGDILYSYKGFPIGKFYGDDLYNFNGRYIGEIKHNNRIIVNLAKKSYIKSCISEPALHSVTTRYCDYVGYAMYAGYEDFKVEK